MIHITKTGNGPPLLLLHGVPDTSALWAQVTASVSQAYTCYAPDLPGFGASPPAQAADYSMAGYAGWVDQMLDAAGLADADDLTLALHDWGGIIGMSWACQNPHRIKRIVCGSFPFDPGYRWHAWARAWRTPLLGEAVMAAMNWPLFKLEFARGARNLSDAHMRQTYAAAMGQAHTRKVILKLYRSADPAQWADWASRLEALAAQVPIAAIWGAHDPYVPLRCGEALHPRRLEVVETAGHWVPAEAPEAYVRALLASEVVPG